MTLENRSKYVELYKSRIVFLDELGLEHSLDCDAPGTRLRDESGREGLISPEEMVLDFDGAIINFMRAAQDLMGYALRIEIRDRRTSQMVFFVSDNIEEFSTLIKNYGKTSELTWLCIDA